MSYLVLARKWRPQTFEDVVGQKPITQALQNAIDTQRVAHAYLFSGPRGIGKTSVARILAKALNCAQGPTGHPCNQCPFCQEIRDGISMDVLEIDGASNRGIDEIRELRENVKYLPSKNKYKVYIIDEVHMLTDQAFNALLKTLEEPPSHVIFILATTEPQKIPLTILSRCQRYNFKRIPVDLMVEHLQKIAREEKVEISEGSLRLISREAQGSLRDAQSLLDQVLSFSGQKVSDDQVTEVLGIIDRKILFDAIQGLAEGDKARLVQIVEEVHNFGYDLKEFCEELIRLVRDLLVLKALPKEGERRKLVDLGEEEIRELSQHGEKFSLEEIHYIGRSLMTAHDELIRSAFPRVILEMTLTRVARRKPILSVEEVLAKLKAMEEKLIGSGGPTVQQAVSTLQPEEEEEPPALAVPPAAPPKTQPPPKGESDEPAGMEEARGNMVPPLPEGMDAEWKEFIHFAKKKKPPLASLLGHASPLALTDSLLEIGYPKESFYLDRMQEKDNLALMHSLCEEFFKRPMKVKITGVNPESGAKANPESGGEDPGKSKNSKKEREEEALNHPIVREAINIFGGRVVEIK
jgi:DNA polymerase III subunit gamma/tau